MPDEHSTPPPWVPDRWVTPVANGGERDETTSSTSETERYDWVVSSDICDSQYRLLVPVPNESPVDDIERIMRTATMFTHERDGDLLIQCLVTVPEQTPYEALTPEEPFVQAEYDTAEQLRDLAEEQDVSADALVTFTHQQTGAILRLIEQRDCDGVLLAISGERSQRQRLLTGSAIEKIAGRAECEVFVEKTATEVTLLDSILLAVSGGPHSGLAAATARTLARASDAAVDAIHLLEADAAEDDQQTGDDIARATAGILDDVDRATVDVVTTDQIAEEIINRSDDYDLTVLGAPTVGLLKQFIFGSVPDSVSQATDNAILMVKRDIEDGSAYARWIASDRSEGPSAEDHGYRCHTCGETFDQKRDSCPDCGGADIRREEAET